MLSISFIIETRKISKYILIGQYLNGSARMNNNTAKLATDICQTIKIYCGPLISTISTSSFLAIQKNVIIKSISIGNVIYIVRRWAI